MKTSFFAWRNFLTAVYHLSRGKNQILWIRKFSPNILALVILDFILTNPGTRDRDLKLRDRTLRGQTLAIINLHMCRLNISLVDY